MSQVKKLVLCLKSICSYKISGFQLWMSHLREFLLLVSILWHSIYSDSSKIPLCSPSDSSSSSFVYPFKISHTYTHPHAMYKHRAMDLFAEHHCFHWPSDWRTEHNTPYTFILVESFIIVDTWQYSQGFYRLNQLERNISALTYIV